MKKAILIMSVLFSSWYYSQEVVETYSTRGKYNGRYSQDVKGYKVGLINSNGDTIVPPLYESIHMPINGSPLIPVFVNDSTICYYDLKGKMVVKPHLNYINTFQDGSEADYLYSEYFIENRNFLCVKKGKGVNVEFYISSPSSSRIYKLSDRYNGFLGRIGFSTYPFENGYLMIADDWSSYSVIDTNGQKVVSITNEFLSIRDEFPTRKLEFGYGKNEYPVFLAAKSYSGTPPFFVVRLLEQSRKKDVAKRFYEVYDRDKRLMERVENFDYKESEPANIIAKHEKLGGYKKIFKKEKTETIDATPKVQYKLKCKDGKPGGIGMTDQAGNVVIPGKYDIMYTSSALTMAGFVAGCNYDFKERSFTIDMYDTLGKFQFSFDKKLTRFKSHKFNKEYELPANEYEWWSGKGIWLDIPDLFFGKIYGTSSYFMDEGFIVNKKHQKVNETKFTHVNCDLGCGFMQAKDSLGNIHILKDDASTAFVLKAKEFLFEEGDKQRSFASPTPFNFYPTEKIIGVRCQLVKTEPREGEVFISEGKHKGVRYKYYDSYFDMNGKQVSMDKGMNYSQSGSYICKESAIINRYPELKTLVGYAEAQDPEYFNRINAAKLNSKSSSSGDNEIKVEDIAPESGLAKKIVLRLYSKTSQSSVTRTEQTFSGLAVNVYESKTTNYSSTQSVGVWRTVNCFTKTKDGIIKQKAPSDYDLGLGDRNEMKREYSDYLKYKNDKNVLVFNSYNEMLEKAKAYGIVKLFPSENEDYGLLQMYHKGNYSVSNHKLLRDGEKYTGMMNGYSPNGHGTKYLGDRIISGNWKNGSPQETMTVQFSTGDKYIGELDDRYMHGNGTYYYKSGEVYTGEFANDELHGYGEYTRKDGTKRKGFLIKDKFSEDVSEITHALLSNSIKTNTIAVNKALQFSHYGSEFTQMYNPLHKIDSTYTMEFWIRMKNSYKENIDQNIVSCMGDKKGYSLSTSNGDVFFQFYHMGNLVTHYSVTIASKQTIDDNKWHHLAIVFKPNQMSLYVDGYLAQSIENRMSIDPYNGGIVFGKTYDKSNYTGEIDEIRFWNVAKDIESIRENMYSCFSTKQNGLLFYYNFSDVDTVRKIIKDVSGNNANAIAKEIEFIESGANHLALPCIDAPEIKARRKLYMDKVKVDLDDLEKQAAAKNIYEGPYVNGKRHGKGKYTYSSGKVYEGDFFEDKFQGNGKMTYTDGSYYEGEFVNNLFEGEGTYYYANGTKYVGHFVEGMFSGKGKKLYKDGTMYEGDFLNDEYNGKGIYYFWNGDRYEGDFKAEKKTGLGTYYFKNGNKYVGNFADGMFEGEGTMYYSNGKIEKCIYSQDKCVTPIK